MWIVQVLLAVVLNIFNYENHRIDFCRTEDSAWEDFYRQTW